MKKIIFKSIIFLVLLSSFGCKKWLDVNKNPNGPELVTPNLYLAPMLYYVMQAEQWDGRFIARYVQNWSSTSALDVWDTMGFRPPPVDDGGETWKLTYYFLGKNLEDMMKLSKEQERWDLLGVGYVLKAQGFQRGTDMYGETVIKQLGQTDRTSFDYDSQEYAYEEVMKLLDTAVTYLERTDGKVSRDYLAAGDELYGGNRQLWIKFAYGMKALNLSHLTNKANYNPAKIIEYVDKSFASNADDALYTFEGGTTNLSNFYGQRRGNLNAVRQTDFVVGLLNGTQFNGVIDPRLSRMLWPSPSGAFKGLQTTYAPASTIPVVADRPPTFFNTTGSATLTSSGRYLFDDVAKVPLMTYSQLQFVKAEAAFRMGSKDIALEAYKKAVEAHIDFVNTTNARVPSGTATQITPAEKTAFLSNVNIIPIATNLKLSHILSQKYIAQFGWAFLETWTDLRRYHYTDLEEEGGQQVFRGFVPPEVTRLYADNLGKVAYRMKPRYASEYVWNRDALEKIGGLDLDFTTHPLWFVNP